MGREKGQALVLFALFIIVLLGFIGLAIDVGRIYVAIGTLRRAVDAASLGAASQFREGRDINEMTAMATQIMNMNGVSPASIVVEDCKHAVISGDPLLCVTPRRKYVRVTASANVPMTFLRVININQISISSNAVGEAASLDVVLVIDISESMAQYQTATTSPVHNVGDQFDPSVCNADDSCQPFEKVRAAANDFVDRILDHPGDPSEESDRLSIVYFSNGWQTDSTKFPYGNNHGATDLVSPGWMNDPATAHTAVNNLKVFQPPACDSDGINPTSGTCLLYNAGVFQGIECPRYRNTDPNDPSSCTTTNSGGALTLAGNLLGDPNQQRTDALWVVIFLSDGAANASNATTGHTYGYCPDTDWGSPFCRDLSAISRHDGGTDPLHYDADDYARDSADFVGCPNNNQYIYEYCDTAHLPSGGQGAVIFTIGLGNQVTKNYTGGDRPAGVALLRYIANIGSGSDPATDPCKVYDDVADWQSHCGNYYYDATGNKLIPVFEDIASRIFTRISR
jgi:Flp pilus assembly protein TadG